MFDWFDSLLGYSLQLAEEYLNDPDVLNDAELFLNVSRYQLKNHVSFCYLWSNILKNRQKFAKM